MPINSLKIQWERVHPREEIANAMESMALACREELSQGLSFINLPPLMVQPHITPQTSSTITHLDLQIREGSSIELDLLCFCVLRGLQTFSITLQEPLWYDEYTITNLLLSWPQAHSVSLNPRPQSRLGTSRLPSMAVLQDVARCGPSLRSFRAFLDGSRGVPPSESTFPTWEAPLELDLGLSEGSFRQTDLEETVEYILKLFPGVRLVERREWSTALAVAIGYVRDTEISVT